MKIGRGGKRPGAGRKKRGEQRKLSLSLPPEMWEMIDKIKAKEGSNQSDVLAELIGWGIETKRIQLMDLDGNINWEGDGNGGT